MLIILRLELNVTFANKIADNFLKYISFVDAKKFVFSLNFKNRNDWLNFCKTGKKHKSIPSNVQRTYKKEWKGWADFLGKNK